MNNGRPPIRPDLSPSDNGFLTEIVGSELWPDFTRSKAKTLLLLTEGQRVQDIAKQLGISRSAVGQRRRRFERGGILSVITAPRRPGRPRRVRPEVPTPGQKTAIADATLERPGPPTQPIHEASPGWFFVI